MKLNTSSDALFLDIDGTLLDIAPRPDEVVVPYELLGILSILYGKLSGALAFLSGRSIEDIDRLFAPLRLPAAGEHGNVIRLNPQRPEKRLNKLPGACVTAVHNAFKGCTDLLIEEKTSSIAVHFRHAPQMRAEVETVLNAIIADSRQELRLQEGKMVLELVAGLNDKGEALLHFMEIAPFKGRRPVFLGDDITDRSAMQACLKFGGGAGQIGRTNPEFRQYFASPAEVRHWLAGYA